MRVLIFFGAIGLCAVLGSVGLKPDATDKRLADYRQRAQVCADSTAGKTRIPIMGGGEIDISRFGFIVPSMSLTDEGECGAVGFEADFYWTGKKIVTSAEVPLVELPGYGGRVKVRDVPQHWHLLRVAAKLGNRRLGKECKAHFDSQKCPDPNYKAPGPTPTWPENLIVRPKAYPGLEIRLAAVRDPRPTGVGFFVSNWPRRDGVTPRLISCFAHEVDFPTHKMTSAQLEQLDFGNRTFPCDIEFNSFEFKGVQHGLAREQNLFVKSFPPSKHLKPIYQIPSSRRTDHELYLYRQRAATNPRCTGSMQI